MAPVLARSNRVEARQSERSSAQPCCLFRHWFSALRCVDVPFQRFGTPAASVTTLAGLFQALCGGNLLPCGIRSTPSRGAHNQCGSAQGCGIIASGISAYGRALRRGAAFCVSSMCAALRSRCWRCGLPERGYLPRQTVQRRAILMGAGNRPLRQPFHQYEAQTGMIGGIGG